MDTEDTICVYKPTRKKIHIIDSVLQKDVECSNIKHASTELEYDESVKKTFIKYQDIVNFIQKKGGTCDESVVLCNLKSANNPVKYTVVKAGPLDVKTGRLSSSSSESSSSSSESSSPSSSESSDFLCFGPVYTSFHSDFGYPHRNSLIPSWNEGVIKFWIIRKECDSRTQRYAVTNPRRKSSTKFTAKDELNTVFRCPADYQLLIQRPGQLVRHNGKHIHCVITAIDIQVNPNSLSLSLGRKDYYSADSYAFASLTKETLVVDNGKKGTYKLVNRKKFIEHQLTGKDYKKMKHRIEADEGKRTRTRKRKGGFQKGNKCSARKILHMVCESKSFFNIKYY